MTACFKIGSRRRKEADLLNKMARFSASLRRRLRFNALTLQPFNPSTLQRVHARRVSLAAFTMIEIAICIAVIGFALVAIIGVLPTAMRVQQDNRADTLIDQDA